MKASCDDDIITSTFHALSDTAKIHAKLEEVAAELSRDLTEGQWTGKTITLKYKLDTFQGGSIIFAFREFVDVLLRSVHSREVAGQVAIWKD